METNTKTAPDESAPWKPFWFDSNPYFGRIENLEDWRRMVDAMEDWPLARIMDAREATFKGQRRKEDRDRNPNFGFYAEHDGDKRLGDFFRENGMSVPLGSEPDPCASEEMKQAAYDLFGLYSPPWLRYAVLTIPQLHRRLKILIYQEGVLDFHTLVLRLFQTLAGSYAEVQQAASDAWAVKSPTITVAAKEAEQARLGCQQPEPQKDDC